MQLSQLVLLAIAAVAVKTAPVEPEPPNWEVTNFSGAHIPHSSYSLTQFNVSSQSFGTAQCSFQKATRSANGLAHFLNKPCTGASGVTFNQALIKNSNGTWSVYVTHNGSSQYAQSSASYYTTNHGAFEWQKLDFGPTFALQAPLGG